MNFQLSENLRQYPISQVDVELGNAGFLPDAGNLMDVVVVIPSYVRFKSMILYNIPVDNSAPNDSRHGAIALFMTSQFKQFIERPRGSLDEVIKRTMSYAFAIIPLKQEMKSNGIGIWLFEANAHDMNKVLRGKYKSCALWVSDILFKNTYKNLRQWL